MKSKAYTLKIKAQPAVVMEAEVARSMENDRTVIEACIPGINATQGGAHVTFTQDTWQHIYKIKDRQFPEQKIVGWYHSHPGFGVFLSEHDLFIHENFFSSPQQVAWVYDPHTDEEGCFGWVGGKTEKLSGMRFGYSQDVQIDSAHVDESGEDGTPDFAGQVRVGPEVPRREPEWLTWTIRIGSYLVVLALGFILGREYLAWRIVPAAQEIERRLMQDEELLQRCEPEFGSCVSRLRQQMMPLNPAPLSPGAGTQNQPKPSQPSPKAPASPGKGNDAKH